MSTDTNSRVPAGVPTGGQFAASAKGEAGVALAASLRREQPDFPRAADDSIDVTAAIEQGYVTGFAVNRAEEPYTRTLVGHWDGNTIVVEYMLDGDVDDEREDTGQWSEGLWAAAATGHSDAEIAAGMLDEYEESDRIRVAVYDSDYTDESEEETCAVEDCDDDLTDNEGYDGYCGHHAELIEAHEDGEHNDYNGTDTHPECPEC